MRPPLLATGAVVLCAASLAGAATFDCGAGGKAKIFDRLASVGTARINYRSAAVPCIQKGPGGTTSQLSGSFDILYVDAPGSVQGAFVMPAPWLLNDATRATFLNTASPAGPTQARRVGFKAAKLARFGSRGLGDTAEIDISSPPGPGGVLAILTVHNAVDGHTYRTCTKWATGSGSIIRYEVIDGGLGRKLFLEHGVVAPCTVVPTTTSTSSSVTSTTSTSNTTTTSTSLTTTTSTSSTTSTSLPRTLRFVTGAPTGVCGSVRSGGTSGTIRKSLGCGGLNVGGGNSTVAEGPTPDNAETLMTATCAGTSCTVTARTMAQTGSNLNCSDTACAFGPYLPIANSGTSTCVRNTFSSPTTGTLNSGTGVFNGSFPLTSTVYLTANAASPCPLCLGGTPGVTNSGVCDAGWTSGAGPSPDAGNACTPVNATGNTHDCNPPPAVVLPGFAVNLSPITTGTASFFNSGGLFCPSQATPGAFGCSSPNVCVGGTRNGLTCTTDNTNATTGCPGAICPGCCFSGTPSICPVVFPGTATVNYIAEVGSPVAAPPVNATPKATTLASVFCIPSVGGGLGFLINGAANLPGPGATSLPGTFQLLP